MLTKKLQLSRDAELVARKRYFFDEKENWETLSLRVASNIAQAEGDKKNTYIEKFQEMIYNMDWIPGGRILRNAGRPRGSLFNCFVLPIGDSIEEIGRYYMESLILWAEGGGVGCNFSAIRPEGDLIMGKGGSSSGLVSFLIASNAIAKTIESGGQRRAAALACLDVTHPEIIDFINAKTTDGVLSHYNISVGISNDFIEAVERDSSWTLKFKQKDYAEVRARDIWDLMLTNMVKHAEPGILNFSNLFKNNSYYYDPVISTNPCIAKGTFISTDRGLIPVEELCNKEFNVVTDLRCINQQGSYTEKAKCFYSGKKQIFRITLSNNQYIDLTDNHKVFIRNGDLVEKVKVMNLKIRDKMMVQNSISLHHVIEKINQKELENGLLVGWRLGDGWISKAYDGVKENRISIGFIVNYEEEIAKNFIKDKINEIKSVSKKQKSTWLKSSGGAKSFELNTSNTDIQKWFEKYGYKTKDDNKKITFQVLRESSSFKRGFIAGLFSADGFCTNYKSGTNTAIGYSSCKEEMVRLVQLLLNEFGISSTIGSAIVKCNLNNKWYNHYNLTISSSVECSKFMNEIGFHLSEKKERAGWNFPRNKWHKKYEGQYWIKSIKLIGEEDVYDITTSVTHSLIANGILIANCGEQPLSAWDNCALGSLVLPNFITGSVNTNWKKLESTIKLAVRFLDDVIDVNKYILKENDIKAHNSRRIGIGVMGLAEYLFSKELRYGSEKSLLEIERLFTFIRNCIYQASIELAIEKGAFPKFDAIAYSKASFVRKLPAQLRMDIKMKGIRNVTLISIAPTGTISLIANVSNGLEPLFAKAYKREDRVSSRDYVHPLYRKIIQNKTKVPEWFVDTDDLKATDHLEVQSVVQKYVDGAVSKTINLSKDFQVSDLDKILLEYIKDLKGVTVYVDGSKEGQVLNKMTYEEALFVVENSSVEDQNRDENDVRCALGGSCEI
jgi:ribonucleoside-diphosphate reductase alpha chain